MDGRYEQRGAFSENRNTNDTNTWHPKETVDNSGLHKKERKGK